MKVNANRVLELCEKKNLQQILGCLSESVLLYVTGIVEFPAIDSFVYLAGEEAVTSEVQVKQIDYLHGRVYVEYKRNTTVYVNDEGKEISWKKDGYNPIEKWTNESNWYEVNHIII